MKKFIIIIFTILSFWIFFELLRISYNDLNSSYSNNSSNIYTFNHIAFVNALLEPTKSIFIYAPIIFLLYGFNNKIAYIIILGFSCLYLFDYSSIILFNTKTPIIFRILQYFIFFIIFSTIIIKKIKFKYYFVGLLIFISFCTTIFYTQKNLVNEERQSCLNENLNTNYCIERFTNDIPLIQELEKKLKINKDKQ